MAHQVQASVQTQVRTQFDRQVTHYLQGSPMADQRLLELILHMAQPTPA